MYGAIRDAVSVRLTDEFIDAELEGGDDEVFDSPDAEDYTDALAEDDMVTDDTDE